MPVLITQIVVILVAAIIFLIGVLARHVFDRDVRVTSLEVAAAFAAGFFIFGIPLCPAVYYALVQTNSDLMRVLPTVVPVFLAGFVARTELTKLIVQKQSEV